MGKVVNGSGRSNGSKLVFVVVGLALLCVNILVLVFVFYVIRLNAGYETKFSFDQKVFDKVVFQGVTNYLNSIGYTPSNDSSKVSSPVRFPEVLIRPGCTWTDFHGRYHCLMDGIEYSTNDYCDLGLIAFIADMKVYIESENGIKIVRLNYIDKPVERGERIERPARDSSAVEDGPFI